MTLAFHNPNRTYDVRRDAVGFVGHDGVFEISFFVHAGVFSKVHGATAEKVDCLLAFDAMRGVINDVARRLYAQQRRKSYVLVESDF